MSDQLRPYSFSLLIFVHLKSAFRFLGGGDHFFVLHLFVMVTTYCRIENKDHRICPYTLMLKGIGCNVVCMEISSMCRSFFGLIKPSESFPRVIFFKRTLSLAKSKNQDMK